jgi:hypothetical protein
VTEEEWLTETTKPQWMIAQPVHTGTYARTKAGKRKLLLYAVGCCRLMWDLLWDYRLRSSVLVAERYADGQATDEERRAASRASMPLSIGTYYRNIPEDLRATVGRLAHDTVGTKAAYAAQGMTEMRYPLGGFTLPDRDGKALLCDMAREVWGNFINPVRADKAWLRWNDRTLPRMAQALYDERAWDRLGVLADALEDAGCEDAAILGHCREPGFHVRGCWVIDLLLGKG